MPDVFNTDFPCLGAQQSNVNQVQHTSGRFAVAVNNFIQQVVGILLCSDGGHSPVQIHPLLAPRNILFVHVGGDIQVGCAVRLLGGFAAFLQHGFIQKLQIHIIANAHHVTGLLGTQQVACTANFQIPHGDFKAGAKFRKVPDGSQTFLSHFG